MDRDEAAAQELVLPEAPGNSSDDSDNERCVLFHDVPWNLCSWCRQKHPASPWATEDVVDAAFACVC